MSIFTRVLFSHDQISTRHFHFIQLIRCFKIEKQMCLEYHIASLSAIPVSNPVSKIPTEILSLDSLPFHTTFQLLPASPPTFHSHSSFITFALSSPVMSYFFFSLILHYGSNVLTIQIQDDV